VSLIFERKQRIRANNVIQSLRQKRKTALAAPKDKLSDAARLRAARKVPRARKKAEAKTRATEPAKVTESGESGSGSVFFIVRLIPPLNHDGC
jgi:hypothetical protein